MPLPIKNTKDTIVLPDHYRKIIAESGRNHVVVNMASNFYDLDELCEQLQVVNRKKNLAKQQVRFRDGIRWIRVERYGSYLYKESLDPFASFQQVDIRKKMTQRDKTVDDVSWEKNCGRTWVRV